MRTWKPTAAGILEIIGGSFQIISGLAIILFSGAVAGGLRPGFPYGGGLGLSFPMIAAIGLPLLVLGVMAIVGGIFALKRKTWGLALAGGICALFPPHSLLGILAIVFVALSKEEF